MSTECPGCGSSLADREDYRKRNKNDTIPTDLQRCPYCGSDKCAMCNMGDDVNCPSCPDDE